MVAVRMICRHSNSCVTHSATSKLGPDLFNHLERKRKDLRGRINCASLTTHVAAIHLSPTRSRMFNAQKSFREESYSLSSAVLHLTNLSRITSGREAKLRMKRCVFVGLFGKVFKNTRVMLQTADRGRKERIS